jgi:hypothetical protein
MKKQCGSCKPIDFIYQHGDTAESLADRLEKSGAIKRYVDQRLDTLLQAEELEYRGRWCDDGGRVDDEQETVR